MVELRDIPTTSFLGKAIGFFGPMNGGKTEDLIREMKRAWYYDFNSIAYNSARNTREKDAISTDGKVHFPAKTVGGFSELTADLKKRVKQLSSSENGGMMEIEGVRHYKGLPLKVVGIDEINLAVLTEQEAREAVAFMTYCREERLALFVAGLLYDFRMMDFGHINELLPYLDLFEIKKPACMDLRNGNKKCANTASHSQRVWSYDFVREQGVERLFEAVEPFDFVDSDKERIIGDYVPAPFFDRTVRIEEERDGRIKYLPVCVEAVRLPYKEETFRVYDAIIRKCSLRDAVPNKLLLDQIVDFLVRESWVKHDDKKGFTPVSCFKNRQGGYTPVAL